MHLSSDSFHDGGFIPGEFAFAILGIIVVLVLGSYLRRKKLAESEAAPEAAH